MSEFRLTPEMIGMNNYSMYDPDKCDGNFCPGDCDCCDKADWDPEEPYDLELGFDPYMGCYTGDC